MNYNGNRNGDRNQLSSWDQLNRDVNMAGGCVYYFIFLPFLGTLFGLFLGTMYGGPNGGSEGSAFIVVIFTIAGFLAGAYYSYKKLTDPR